jgi:tRNA A-37 threonylcarbamoyl transferase component Bud32
MSEIKNELIRFRSRGYRLYTREKAISPSDVERLIDLVERAKKTPMNDSKTLYGRTALIEGTLENGRALVVKSYHRGGFLRHLLPPIHLRIFETRCRRESLILEKVKSLNGKVPQAICYVEEGEFFYNGWLVTERIQDGVNLLDYIAEHPAETQKKLSLLSEQMKILIQAGIHHVDLHPGNAVVAGDGSVFIVDFDKAYFYCGRKNTLRDLYLRRWRRAVIKHRLPEVLTEMVSLALRENFEYSSI